jgi:hypothetical protein
MQPQRRGGTVSGTPQPPLRRLHPDQTILSNNRTAYNYWAAMSTQEIIDSLRVGQPEPLIVKSDGTVMQGNTRIMILQQRGVDVSSLPRVAFP